MTNHTPNFILRLKGITLSANERLQMRERLAAYSDLHPVFDAETGQSSPLFAFFASKRISVYATAFLLFVVVGSSVSFAAEGSAPGDALYQLKIHVNEPVMTALAPTERGQATIAAELATRRVDEAVTLASRGTLTAERQAYLTEQFTDQVKVAAQKTDKLTQSGNNDAAENVKANFAASLAGEAQALGAVSAKNHLAVEDDTKTRGEFLAVVLATSENISGMGSQATDLAEGDDAETASSTTILSAKTASGLSASTTAGIKAARALERIRFAQHLHITASTTLSNTKLNAFSVPAIKTDVAIPHDSVSGDESTLSPSGGLQSGD